MSEPNDSTEQQWLRQAQKDPAAFEQIFNAYHERIFNYVLRRTCDVYQTQDIAATVFLKALDNIKAFKWRGVSLSVWLYRIATNEVNLWFRRRKRLTPLTGELSSQLPDECRADANLLEIEEAVLKNQQFQKAVAAISKLKMKYQNVLTLRYFEQKTIREVAEILNLSENTVKTHIRRGLLQLREKI